MKKNILFFFCLIAISCGSVKMIPTLETKISGLIIEKKPTTQFTFYIEENVAKALKFLSSNEFKLINKTHITTVVNKTITIFEKMINTSTKEIKLNEK